MSIVPLVLLPLIGCWREDDGGARELYGVAGNLVARAAEACASESEWSARDEESGVRTLRLSARWQLVETAAGERYLIYRAAERYELPR